MKNLINALKSKNREEISSAFNQMLASTREWLQENGEWALFVGILGGVLFVLFFEVVIVIVVLGGLASFMIWQLSSEPESSFSNDLNAGMDNSVLGPQDTPSATEEDSDSEKKSSAAEDNSSSNDAPVH